MKKKIQDSDQEGTTRRTEQTLREKEGGSHVSAVKKKEMGKPLQKCKKDEQEKECLSNQPHTLAKISNIN